METHVPETSFRKNGRNPPSGTFTQITGWDGTMESDISLNFAFAIAISLSIVICLMALVTIIGPEERAKHLDLEDLDFFKEQRTERFSLNDYERRGEIFLHKALQDDDANGNGFSTVETFLREMMDACPPDVPLHEFILGHIQREFAYVTDDEQFGFLDWAAYPIETIASGKGDCEDLAILIAALLHRAGYDCGFALFGDHVVAMVDVPLSGSASPEGYRPFSISRGGKTYRALECCGDCPAGFTFERYSFDDVKAFVIIQ